MRTFDIANPDTAVHARVRTTVPQQALAALNAPVVVEAAQRLAARATAAGGDNEAYVRNVWREALSRDPDPQERVIALEWLAAEPEPASAEQPADRPRPEAAVEVFGPRERLAQAVLATAEFEFVD